MKRKKEENQQEKNKRTFTQENQRVVNPNVFSIPLNQNKEEAIEKMDIDITETPISGYNIVPPLNIEGLPYMPDDFDKPTKKLQPRKK